VSALANSTGGIYDRIGRGVPDVAVVRDNIAVYGGGKFQLSEGTSTSTPIFAGKGPVGFLKPTLYGFSAV